MCNRDKHSFNMEFVNIKIEKYAIAIRLSIYANIHIHNIFGQRHKRDIKI